MDEGVEAVSAEALEQENFDAAAAGLAPPQEPGWKHPRVVDDEQIPRPEPRRQIADAGVGDRASDALEHQEPRGAALGRRRLRDLLGWQVEVEVGDEHAAPW